MISQRGILGRAPLLRWTTCSVRLPGVRALSLSSVARASDPSPSGYGFPTTLDHDRSPFKDVSVGKSRIVMPTFNSPEEEDVHRREHLAAVFRVLAREGHAEGIAGHCSTRSAVNPSQFFINPWTKSFHRMRASDLVLVDSQTGNVVESELETQQRSVDASATGLHAPIYRDSKDVQAVVHVHGAYSKSFSALGRELDMINQDVCAFKDGVIDIAFEGVVLDQSEGTQIAARMTPSTKIALLQNHGSLAVGTHSIDEAAWWWLSFEMCCRAQLLVLSALGGPSTHKPRQPVLVNQEAIDYTHKNIGYPEMGTLSFAGYYEREEWETGGDFKK